MKKLELKFGTPLTKEQMKKIAGGKVERPCVFYYWDGSSEDMPCDQLDPDGNPMQDACQLQCDSMVNAAMLFDCQC